jgi:hypothetical protein
MILDALSEVMFPKTAFASPSSDLGSARVSRVGDGVLAVADFLEACLGKTPKPTRETSALPGLS